MREIKFRAWHHGAGDPRIAGYMVNSHPFPVKFWTNVENEPLAVEVMQYTGLKDKNGTEIYESDVIELDEIQAVITFDNGSYQMITSENQGRSQAIQERTKRFEVIGNIHENPELLE